MAAGIGLGLVLGWFIVASRNAAREDAAATSKNLTTAVSREVGRTIEMYDLTLQSALRALRAPAFNSLDPASRQQLLFDGMTDAHHNWPLAVADAEGHIIDRSGGLSPQQTNVADRDFFLVHQYRSVSGRFISRPYRRSLTQEWAIALSRRVTGPDGAFAGIVVASIQYSYFADLFGRLELAPNTAITLLRDDGTIIYRTVPGKVEPGVEAGHDTVLERLRAGRPEPFEGVSEQTGRPSLIAFARISDLPLVLCVATPLTSIYAGWTGQAVLLGVLAVILLLTLWLSLHAVARQRQGRLVAERREAEVSEHGNREYARLKASEMESVSRLTAGIAHDFNNVLQTITSSLEIITTDYLRGADARELADIAQRAATQGAKLTHRLLSFSRQQVLQPRRVNVPVLLADLRKLMTDAHAFEAPVTMSIAIAPYTADLLVDATQVESCLVNLLLNARDAMPQGGSIRLSARDATADDRSHGAMGAGRHVVLTVRDTGRGMNETTLAHAFEPFFTTKPFGTGAGLGLSMAQGFCHQSGGDIRIMGNGVERGVSVVLSLPSVPEDVGSERGNRSAGRRAGRLLLVDSQADALASCSAILVAAGFEVVSVASVADAAAYRQLDDEFDGLLMEQTRQAMTGMDFLSSASPGLPTIVLTDFEPDDTVLSTLPQSVRLLRSPVHHATLLGAVRDIIGERRCLPVNPLP